MTFRRRNAGVVAHNGLLYVVGGDDGTSNLANVEVNIFKICDLKSSKNLRNFRFDPAKDHPKL